MGGYWDIFVEVVNNNSNNLYFSSNFLVVNGEGFFNNDVGIIGIGMICWDGVNNF